MEPTFPINYRAGWIEPVDEYIPEIMEPKPEWTTPSRLPDYGPVVDDDPQPTHFITDPSKTYQKMQYTEPFHQKHPTTEFINDPTYWICQFLSKIQCISHKQVPKENHYA